MLLGQIINHSRLSRLSVTMHYGRDSQSILMKLCISVWSPSGMYVCTSLPNQPHIMSLWLTSTHKLAETVVLFYLTDWTNVSCHVTSVSSTKEEKDRWRRFSFMTSGSLQETTCHVAVKSNHSVYQSWRKTVHSLISHCILAVLLLHFWLARSTPDGLRSSVLVLTITRIVEPVTTEQIAIPDKHCRCHKSSDWTAPVTNSRHSQRYTGPFFVDILHRTSPSTDSTTQPPTCSRNDHHAISKS